MTMTCIDHALEATQDDPREAEATSMTGLGEA